MSFQFSYIKNLSDAAKASLALFLSSLITKGIAYISTPFYTRLLTSEEFGQVSVFMSWQNIIGIVAMFSLMNGVFNNGMVDYPTERDKYSFSMMGLSNTITFVCGIVLIIIYPYVADFIKIEPTLMLLMFLVFLTQPAFSFWSAKERYEFKWKWLMVWSILLAFISPLIAILCIIVFKDHHLYARLFGAELPLILVYCGFYIYLGEKSSFKIEKKYWKEAFLFNLPLIPHYLSTLLLSSAAVFIISYFCDYTSVAYYSVAFSISTLLTIAITAINASLIPYTYEKCKVGDFSSLSRVTMPLLAFLAVLGFILILFSPEILAIMATSDYGEAVYIIPPVVVGVFFQALYYVFANVVFYYKRPVFVMISSVIATIISITLNYFLIPKFGYLVAGYTTMACYGIQAILDFVAMRYVLGKNIYDIKRIIILSLLVVITGLSCLLLYKNIYIRYSIIFIFLIGGVCYRKRLLNILNNLFKFKSE